MSDARSITIRRIIREDVSFPLNEGETIAEAKQRAIAEQASLEWFAYDTTYSVDEDQC